MRHNFKGFPTARNRNRFLENRLGNLRGVLACPHGYPSTVTLPTSRGRTLPRRGVVHVTSLSAHLPQWLHVQPYRDSLLHAVSDLINGQEDLHLQLAQVRTPDGDGLGSDGPYGTATSCLAAVVVAVTALSNPEKVPSHLKDTLGCIRVFWLWA